MKGTREAQSGEMNGGGRERMSGQEGGRGVGRGRKEERGREMEGVGRRGMRVSIVPQCLLSST